MKNFGKTTSLCLLQFHTLTGWDIVSHFFGIPKACGFQRLLEDTRVAYLVEKLGDLGESATVSENLTYQVRSFIQIYIYLGKTNEESLEARMRQYNTMKTRTTRTILPDLPSLKEHIKRANLQAYHWWHYLEHSITKVEPCRAG